MQRREIVTNLLNIILGFSLICFSAQRCCMPLLDQSLFLLSGFGTFSQFLKLLSVRTTGFVCLFSLFLSPPLSLLLSSFRMGTGIPPDCHLLPLLPTLLPFLQQPGCGSLYQPQEAGIYQTRLSIAVS